MLLHAAHASSTFSKIVIATPDSDVFMIVLPNLDEIEVIFITGTKDKRRVIDLSTVCRDANERFNKTNLAYDVFMKALHEFHGFTGCHSVSAFSKR